MSDERLCKNCKWWDNASVTISASLNHGLCEHKSNASEDPDGFGYYAIDWQGSNPDQYLNVTTGPDFGCVHFEQRQAES